MSNPVTILSSSQSSAAFCGRAVEGIEQRERSPVLHQWDLRSQPVAGPLAAMPFYAMAASAVDHLQANQPQLATIRDVEIIKCGIEYPLASGPATFTPDDLKSVVESQDDPAIPRPRIYLGHPDDSRIHGERVAGTTKLSGEPAVGSVSSMYLANEGTAIRGDLEGLPLWLARILSSAYPSRSVEGNWDVGPTPTGHKWPMIIHGLALLGVCWPGVSTLEDIASLYTPDGPEGIEIIEATPDAPVTITAAAERLVRGKATVEDVRRQYYDSLSGDESWWWITAIYLEPDELIVDDNEGCIYRVPFSISGEQVTFEEAKKVKIKYVNASTGLVAQTDDPHHNFRVVAFQTRTDARPQQEAKMIEFVMPTVIEFKIK